MNYICFGGIFGLNYIYVDLYTGNSYVADSLFVRRKIPVRYKGEYVKKGIKYRIICCRIARKHRASFEEALGEISNKMSLLGHNDYDTFCEELKSGIENEEA